MYLGDMESCVVQVPKRAGRPDVYALFRLARRCGVTSAVLPSVQTQ